LITTQSKASTNQENDPDPSSPSTFTACTVTPLATP
jgi:hypothetical protein